MENTNKITQESNFKITSTHTLGTKTHQIKNKTNRLQLRATLLFHTKKKGLHLEKITDSRRTLHFTNNPTGTCAVQIQEGRIQQHLLQQKQQQNHDTTHAIVTNSTISTKTEHEQNFYPIDDQDSLNEIDYSIHIDAVFHYDKEQANFPRNDQTNFSRFSVSPRKQRSLLPNTSHAKLENPS